MEASASRMQPNSILQTLPLVTYYPVGNPLLLSTPQQRKEFFTSLSSITLAQVKGGSGTGKVRSETFVRAMPGERNMEGRPAEDMQVVHTDEGLKTVFYPSEPKSAEPAKQALSYAIAEHAKGEVKEAASVLTELRIRVIRHNYEIDDLMGVLLLIIEDRMAKKSGSLQKSEPNVGTPKPSLVKAPIASVVPEIARLNAKESAVVRLASVREMLRYYFERHPREYRAALAAALGMTSDQEGDDAYLQERLAYALSSIGSFALAQKILSHLRLRKKMDTKKCLSELGFRYDRSLKTLILGKRTCTPVSQASKIAIMLHSLSKKK